MPHPNYETLRDIESTNTNNCRPSTQLVFWGPGARKPVRSRLVTVCMFDDSINLSTCLKGCNYLVRLISKLNRTPVFRAPNRLVSLNLQASTVYCINNTISRLNNKETPIRLPKSLLTLNILATLAPSAPSGSFRALYFSNNCYSQMTRQAKHKESTIDLLHLWCIIVRFTYLPKSIANYDCGNYPCEDDFRRLETKSIRIYNTSVIVTRIYACTKFSTRYIVKK